MTRIQRPRYGDIFAGHDEGASMAEQAKVLWEEYKADLEARGLWNRVRARTADRLARISAEYMHYYPIAVAEGPVTIGPNGGDVASMLWSQVRNMGEQIAKLEKSLTVTPESVGAKAEGAKTPSGKSASAKWREAYGSN